MKLGLIAVYLLKENAGPLLELHLDRIRRHTDVPYTIYGAGVRLQPRFRRILDQHPRVKMVDVPPIAESSMSREHGYYLDALVDAAMRDGVTHLCALHVDSFPIRDGWAQDLASHIDGRCIGAAIFRAENGDRVLPLPAGFMFSREFQEEYRPRFFVLPEVEGSAGYQRFMREFGVELDSGMGYAYEIQRHGLTWKKLLRSNRRNDHYLMAGIYGDTFFHLGAAARTSRLFRGDFRGAGAPPIFRLRWHIDRACRRLPAAVYARLQRWTPDHQARMAEAEAGNHANFETIYERLVADPENYIASLRTGRSCRMPVHEIRGPEPRK